MILVQMYNIFGLLIGVPDYSIRSESYGRKQKNVEKDWHLNKQEFRITVVFFCFFSKNEEGANPPGGKKYLGTTKIFRDYKSKGSYPPPPRQTKYFGYTIFFIFSENVV